MACGGRGEFPRARSSHRVARGFGSDGHRTLDLFEIVIILAVALIVLGPERLPEVMRTVGKILRELRLASNTVLHELTDVLEEPPPAAPTAKIPPAAVTAPRSDPPASPPAAAPPEKT